MTKKDKTELAKHIETIIIKVVNGRIDLAVKIATDTNTKLCAYIVEDNAWKVRAEPVVKAFENTNWLWRLLISTLKFLD